MQPEEPEQLCGAEESQVPPEERTSWVVQGQGEYGHVGVGEQRAPRPISSFTFSK